MYWRTKILCVVVVPRLGVEVLRMKLLWRVEDADVTKVRSFYDEHKDNEFVVARRKRNVEGEPPTFSRPSFWKLMVGCLLTTQQRSGPTSAVSRFGGTEPFPLNYTRCKRQRPLEDFVRATLVDFGGIRRNIGIAEEVRYNFDWLEDGVWHEVRERVEKLRRGPRTQKLEISTADFIDDNLKGFGPKQARNLLQELGLTKYEIPIDSRITKWLNDFGFPVKLSASALQNREYYGFVSKGVRELSDASGIYPCLLDAAIFSSYD